MALGSRKGNLYNKNLHIDLPNGTGEQKRESIQQNFPYRPTKWHWGAKKGICTTKKFHIDLPSSAGEEKKESVQQKISYRPTKWC